ncbi:hypothetical protein AcW1_003719 [Taiwanofungus camphoratus]|nr:hypothetical protein AcW1_003719 [Antrodia cinnamomea]
MSAKVYVGNLSWNTTDDSLRQAFSAYGQILDSIVMRDRDTGRSRGFGFVTYSSGMEAQSAITNLNEQELDGRRIKVNLANARGGGGGGGGGYSGGGGNGGYSGGGYSGKRWRLWWRRWVQYARWWIWPARWIRRGPAGLRPGRLQQLQWWRVRRCSPVLSSSWT